MIETKKKYKIDTSKITDLTDDVIKPDSLENLMSKYNLSFPFQARCVKEFYNSITGEPCDMKGKIFTYIKTVNHSDGSVGGLSKERPEGSQDIKSKKFVLYELNQLDAKR